MPHPHLGKLKRDYMNLFFFKKPLFSKALAQGEKEQMTLVGKRRRKEESRITGKSKVARARDHLIGGGLGSEGGANWTLFRNKRILGP